ncbi:hypothetical protein ABPG75_008410 [Micractinium tetrahymenae]
MCAGAPLVSSDGHILGSLGVMDVKPRTFPAGALNVICNFAELVVREMERDKAQQQAQQHKVETALNARRHMVRALSCFQEPVMLCNVAMDGWQILYCNENWCTTTGFSEPACLNSSFWDLFRPPASAGLDGKKAAQQAAADRQPFSIVVEGGHCASMALELKPASKDHLSTAVPTIGIPNFVEGLEPGELKALDGYFFAVAQSVQHVGGSHPGSSQPSAPSSSSGRGSERRAPQHSPLDSLGSGSAGSKVASLVHSDMRSVYSYAQKSSPFGLDPPESLGDLNLGPLLGKGGYGRVYRGNWKSAAVAVKVIDTWVDPQSAEPTQPMLEALFSKNLTHPNIVQCFDFAFQIFQSDGPDSPTASANFAGPNSRGSESSGAPPPGHKPQQIWIVQQYCNHGTLGDAVDRGWLFKARAPDGARRPNLWAVLPTAQEIAAALRYLHSEGVIHGDLTPGNVLLTGARHTQRRDPRSFQAKVGDFGLASVAGGARSSSGTLGTMSHMPLELIEQEVLTPAADVFAFGVLCWEMLSGRRAWAGLTSMQILTARSTNKERLEVPAGCPRGLRELVESCLSDDHTQRPSFDGIVAQLDRLMAEAEARAAATAASPPAPASPPAA